MKYASIDIETTGLDEKTCDILEFGAVLDDLSCPKPIDQLPRFHCYFLPPSGENYTGSPFALSMHPAIFLRIANREKPFDYISPHKLGFAFKKFLAKNGYVIEKDRITINVAGKNFGSFDLKFLEAKTDLLKHVGIRHRIIDPSSLYYREGDEALPGTEECKRRYNSLSGESIPTKVEHNAIADAIDVIYLVRYALSHRTFLV